MLSINERQLSPMFARRNVGTISHLGEVVEIPLSKNVVPAAR